MLVIGATGQQAARPRGTFLNVIGRSRPGALPRFARRQDAAAIRADLARGDLDDPASLRAAMEDAHGVFLVLTMMAGPRISPEGVVAETAWAGAADLAHESGIEHLVYSSLNGAAPVRGSPTTRARRGSRSTSTRSASGTILRPVSFMDNFATYNRPVLDGGELVVNLAVRPELPMQLISVRDIGAFAAIAFDRPDQFVGRTVEIAETTHAAADRRDLWPCLRPAGTFPPDAHRADPCLRRPAGPDVHVLQRTPLRAGPPPGAAAEHPGLMRLETWLRETGWKP